jgi:hypothetical protein
MRNNLERLQIRQQEPHEQMESLIQTRPQRNSVGGLQYLITNGLAVELITGVSRPHDDLDIVVLQDNMKKWRSLGIDVITPRDYFAGMILDPHFLQATAQKVTHKNQTIYTIHPGIILVQKATGYEYNGVQFPRRPKDIAEVTNILTYWRTEITHPNSWDPIILKAINALPKLRQIRTIQTLQRIEDVMDEIPVYPSPFYQ